MTVAAPSAETRQVLLILSAGNFVIGMGAFIVIGLIEPVAASFSISPAEAGWLLTVYAISYAILSPTLTALTGQIGRRRVLTVALGLFALATALGSIAATPALLFASRILAAAGAGLFTPNTAAVAAALSAPESRGRALASVFTGLTLAQVAGVPAGSFIAYSLGWRPAPLLVTALALPCLWLIWTRVPSGLPFQPTRLADLRRVLARPLQMLAILFTTTFLGGIYVLYTYIAPLLSSQMGYGGTAITVALLILGIGAVIGNLTGGRLVDRIGPHRTLTALVIAQIILLPLFSLLPFSELLLMLLLFLWSTAGYSFNAPQQMRLLSLAPAEANVVLALNAAAIYIGAAAGSAIGGAILQTYGAQMLGIAAAGVAVLALIQFRISAHLSR